MTHPKQQHERGRGPFGFSDATWIAIVGAVVTLSTTANTAIQAYMASAASKKVEQVKATLEESTKKSEESNDKILSISQDTHVLVNSAMGAQLRLNAQLSRSKADLSGDAADEAAAELAEKSYKEHQDKQRIVDKGISE